VLEIFTTGLLIVAIALVAWFSVTVVFRLFKGRG
jgi:hypothetical protein